MRKSGGDDCKLILTAMKADDQMNEKSRASAV
jgi:hypothetical protein